MSVPPLCRAEIGSGDAAAHSASPTVWHVALDASHADVARAEELLTDDERKRARRGTEGVHRRRVLLRAGLRRVLAVRLGVPARAVPLRVGVTGRPELAFADGLDVNCSASGAVGLIAVADGVRVGIDVQRVAPWDPDVLAEGWLSAGERAAVVALPEAERPEAVTRSWTQKEAVLKGLGTGLSGGLARVVTPIGRASGAVGEWQVRNVAVPHGCVATVATAPWSTGDR